MVPERAFFAVQAAFADRWTAVAGIPLADAALATTTWYHQVGGFGRDFDAAHLGWRTLTTQLAIADDAAGLLHATARATARATASPSASASVLGFAWNAEEFEIRLTFRCDRPGNVSPLASSELATRRAELRELVELALREHPDARWIRGRSWLYDLEAYRRIFPSAFIRELTRLPPDLQFLACWGQLLDRFGRVRADLAERFLTDVAAAATTDALEAAFPHPMLETRMDAHAFAVSAPMR